MPKTISVQNNFIRGLITEATGLNFPENAATDTQNCVFTLIGDVTRRLGINYEDNATVSAIGGSGVATSTYRWKNAGGDGETELVALQIGSSMYFYESSSSTVTSPLSTTLINSVVDIAHFQAQGNGNNVATVECQYASGNGYLFVFHPDCDPFFCTFSDGTITANLITVQIRDFQGISEPIAVDVRPLSLSSEHNYNLLNQGWVNANSWGANSTTSNNFVNTGSLTFTIQTGISGVSGSVNITYTGAPVGFAPNQLVAGATMGATVTSYDSGTGALVVTVYATNTGSGLGQTGSSWDVNPISQGNITTFFSDVGTYPANCDVWFTFKNSSGAFAPNTTAANVVTTTTNAPKGHFILDAFEQDRTFFSGVSSLTPVTTTARPSNGAFFQGRVWYTGVNSSQAASGDATFYTWTENIYFSQIIVPGDSNSFGNCYQTNDPTNENLFDLLPTDGGVITIQGCGNIYKLFPIQNGMLVFADNGVWFITGSQGIGFTASDYTITKISSVQSISSTSFIEAMGLPFFWNEEGIYRVTPAQSQGIGLAVEPLTVGTILSFYNKIPLDSKVYVRGDYDPVNYVIKWVYRSTQEAGISNRYQYDSILNFNIYNKAFYPYTVSSTSSTPYINGIFYLNYPNSITAPEPTFKYICSKGSSLTFAEENDVDYLDWSAVSGQNFTSYFTTGYSLQGKGVMKHQPLYVYVYSRNNVPFSYTIQGRWDYSISGNSGRWSSTQTAVNGLGQPNFGMIYRRHKIRGHGEVLQLNVSSVQGQPFDIMGWVIPNQIDAGV